MKTITQKLKQTALAGLVAASAMYSAGCGTILTSDPTIPVYSEPSGKTFKVFDFQKNDTCYVGKTPGSFKAEKGNNRYAVKIEDQVRYVEPKANPLIWVNLLTCPIGLLVDAFSGSTCIPDDTPLNFVLESEKISSPDKEELPIKQKLNKLDLLKNQGILSEREYNSQKEKLVQEYLKN